MREKTERIEQVGPDRVTISDQQVIIEARRPMPDWEVRDLDPAPVYFGDKKYYLAEKRRGEGRYAVRYLLLPWPEGQSTYSKRFYAYDAEAVAERDGNCRSEQANDLAYAFLLPIYPLLGLLWSGTQKRLSRFGVVPRTVTSLSIFTVFSLLFGQGVFAVVTIQATVRTSKMLVGGMITALSPVSALKLGPVTIPLAWLDVLLTLALLADLAIRYSHYLREDQWIGGFLEWIARRAPEDEESTREFTRSSPPPLPGVRRSQEQHRFFARLSLWLPLGVFLVCVGIGRAFGALDTAVAQRALAFCGWVMGAGLMAGVGFSIAAMCGIRRHGSRGILGPAVWGLLLSSGLFVIFLSGAARGVHNAQIIARARETTRNVTADLSRELTNSTDLANPIEARQAGVDKIRGALDNISDSASGETALIAKASSAHLAKMQALMTNYGVAFNALRSPPVLDMRGVTDRQQLLAREQSVKKFITANENLRAFVSTRTESYRADLRAAGVTSSQMAAAMENYQKSEVSQQPVLMRIRDDDRTIGDSMLATLELLDSNWGKWTYNPTRKKVDFQDPATLDKYMSYRDALQIAAKDQQTQQVKMASLMQQ
jgi:hypothetical protein